MFCDLSPIQFDISDLQKNLLIDAEIKISNDIRIRNYQKEFQRIEKIKNFKKLNYTFYPELPRCNFSVYEISKKIELQLKERFSILGDIASRAYYRYQMVSGVGILLPHRDENRKSSIVILLNGEGQSDFYEEEFQSDSIFPDPDNMKLAFSCNMKIGETWIYNHHSIHSVRIDHSPRIAFSLGFDDIYANELYDHVQSKSLRT